ncbi:MAG: hypothetical protein HOP12_13025 [Candidatus Eisenbacteria bacterium]|uniref:Porin family protein n=1 Tax=Eiseniibacteriota bacterium TaxID=2212470 RepID=A0A849SQ73_UNCEI|nr:hypothetical protein [Candidatus Eisenbacteria bacterium]
MKQGWSILHRPGAVVALVLTVALAAGLVARESCAQSTPAPADTSKAATLTRAEKREARSASQIEAARKKEANRTAKREKIAKEEAEDVTHATPWQKGANWMSLRFGYAKSAADFHAPGNVGGGFGYNRFVSRRWAAGVHANLDLLGRFGAAAEVSAPLTIEMTRHFKWNTGARPYIGLGAGAFYYHVYRSGQDYSMVRPGMYLTGGMNVPISGKSLIGVDTRMQWSSDAKTDNVTFPDEGPNVMHWSIKLNYSRWM